VPRSISQDTTRIVQLQPIKASTPSSRKQVLLGPAFWEPVREQAHRIREPDPGILRYTLRYAISTDLAKQIHDVSTAEGIDPDLAFRLIRVESRFAPRARSPMGALGLMQLMPGTARRLDPSLKSEAQILDPRTNLRLGLRYLRGMIERYDDVRLGLLAYNRGPGAVDRALRQGKDPENGYSRKVLGGTSRYRGPGVLPPGPRS
jgi:soluble lytic murein transglycosylase-like protein